MQIISQNKTVRIDTVQNLKEFNAESLSTKTKMGEQLLSMMPAIKKALNLLIHDIVDLHTQKRSFKKSNQ